MLATTAASKQSQFSPELTTTQELQIRLREHPLSQPLADMLPSWNQFTHIRPVRHSGSRTLG
ncbi:hypothetical protein EGR_02863 [Echinococcus granulosus]|uniref:Uncharacterized protein n=1 Tax=Echinococcus granulosus TaxID=6210 RepID=W6ULJ5_ECHGR|nr:hypothetical protein EGR_02863 [Echinococcus granulosus]EUB62410.1 hypothetical protein EGR_02863 [Echinococcus granulosus]